MAARPPVRVVAILLAATCVATRGLQVGARIRTNPDIAIGRRSEEHTSELQSLMSSSYADFCLKKKKEPHSHIWIRVEATSTTTKTIMRTSPNSILMNK